MYFEEPEIIDPQDLAIDLFFLLESDPLPVF